MKRLFKIGLKLVKWYSIADILMWAFIGSGCFIESGFRHQEVTPIRIFDDAIHQAENGWSRVFSVILNDLKEAWF